MNGHFDWDWIVIGSGFGGSVAALRLAEKGYSVCVKEAGRRFADDEFATSTWDLRKYLYMPRLGLKGVLRISPMRDVSILSGAGVGGGSLGYANTLYRAPKRFFEDPQWGELADWEAEFAPHYDTAERMLGVAPVTYDDPGDDLLKQVARGPRRRGHPRQGQRRGVLRRARQDRAGPVLRRRGAGAHGMREVRALHDRLPLQRQEHAGEELPLPRRAARREGRRRAQGGRHRAAGRERRLGWLPGHNGAHRRVVQKGPPLGDRARGGLRRRDDGHERADAGLRARGSLPRISHRLGYLVRTNSEAIVAVTSGDKHADFGERVAITGSIYPDPDTHIETVTYGDGGGAMARSYTLLTGQGTRRTRPLRLLAEAVRKPRTLFKTLVPGNWSRRTLILLVMQTLDNSIRLRPIESRAGHVRLQTEQDPDNPNPTYIAAANDVAERLATKVDGYAQSSVMEALANIPTTAHILGGAVIGRRRGTRRDRPGRTRLRLRADARDRRCGDPREPRRQPQPHDHRAGRAHA